MVRRTGQMGVPVIADELEAIVGFDVRRLEAMVARQRAQVRLGLRVKDAPGGGAEVILVHPDSAGERAGVQAGDVVLAIGARPVEDGAALEAAWRAGESGVIRVRRAGRILDLRVR